MSIEGFLPVDLTEWLLVFASVTHSCLGFSSREFHRIRALLRLEKTFKVIMSNHHVHHHVPKCYLHRIFESFQGWSLQHCIFQFFTTLSVKKFFLISNLNLPWCDSRPCRFFISFGIWRKVTLQGALSVFPCH